MISEKPSVLIIDDNEEDVAHLRSILQSIDCTIQIATNDREALENISEIIPNLVILNLDTLTVNGYETAKIIRGISKNSPIPILFLVATGDSENGYQQIEEWEDSDILRRPFYPFDLASRCKALLNLRRYENELEMAGQVVESLALAVEARDPTTGNHCDRLFFRLTKMANVLELGHALKDTLLKGAVLHDIGKVGVPDHILLKEGPLTDREWEVMRRHVIIGESLCRPLKFLNPVLPLIRHHHERYDGSGYPDGLEGTAIPLVARVFQVCDVFDALTNPRPYKPAFSNVEAIQILENETTRGWWDPAIVEAFLRVIGNEP